MRIGFSQFAQRCKGCGATGVILSDMAPDDSEEWRQSARENDISTIFLAAPTSTDERIECVARASSGFVYCVSRTGVTGSGSEVPPEVSDTVRRIKRHTNLPVCVGFGISKPEHVKMVCEVADGAVVGSSIVEFLNKHWNNGEGKEQLIQYIRALKAATNG
jgi:tryptophan synthase alpha chain